MNFKVSFRKERIIYITAKHKHLIKICYLQISFSNMCFCTHKARGLTATFQVNFMFIYNFNKKAYELSHNIVLIVFIFLIEKNSKCHLFLWR